MILLVSTDKENVQCQGSRTSWNQAGGFAWSWSVEGKGKAPSSTWVYPSILILKQSLQKQWLPMCKLASCNIPSSCAVPCILNLLTPFLLETWGGIPHFLFTKKSPNRWFCERACVWPVECHVFHGWERVWILILYDVALYYSGLAHLIIRALNAAAPKSRQICHQSCSVFPWSSRNRYSS